MYRQWKEGKDDQYASLVKKQVELTRAEAQKDGVRVPETLEEYCIKAQPRQDEDCLDALDMDEDYYDDYGESDGDEEFEENGEDSGQGEN